MKGAFVQLFDDTDPLRSDVTLCVAALLTLGIPAAGGALLHFTAEHVRGASVRRAVWTFADADKAQRFATRTMADAWNDADWLLKNPTHPLAIIRASLTYGAAVKCTPKYTAEYRARVETPDTWRETAMHNLLILLSRIPGVSRNARGIVRFATDHAAYVPISLPEIRKTELIKYVEYPSKRAAQRTAA